MRFPCSATPAAVSAPAEQEPVTETLGVLVALPWSGLQYLE
jgi:hypothetical protein